MKRIAVLSIVLLMGISLANAEVNIPNLEGTILLNLQDGTLSSGLTSKILSVGDFDFRVGYSIDRKSVV